MIFFEVDEQKDGGAIVWVKLYGDRPAEQQIPSFAVAHGVTVPAALMKARRSVNTLLNELNAKIDEVLK